MPVDWQSIATTALWIGGLIGALWLFNWRRGLYVSRMTHTLANEDEPPLEAIDYLMQRSRWPLPPRRSP